jgi:hypothetical protein
MGETAVTGVAYPERLRPNESLTAAASGPGSGALQFELLPELINGQIELAGQRPNGSYRLEAFVPGEQARCGWLQPLTDRCLVGEVIVDGVAIPAEATNFGDKIALLGLDLPTRNLLPGGIFELTADWLAIAPPAEDWTVFVQVLAENDQIVGQVDQFPLQGTRPTSGWQRGEQISDPYRIPISPDALPGDYRLIIGFYRLSDLQRLPIFDESGSPINDKFLLPGLTIPDR